MNNNKNLVGNVIEQAIKVTTFRENIRKACRKEGLDYPTDEQIAAYIEDGCAFDVNDLMDDYKEKIGVFRTPLKDFTDAIDKFTWAEGHKPTIEEVTEWTEKNGYNVSLFLRERTIKSFKPFYRKTIEKALKLNDNTIIELWNFFIKESAWYGEDSHIYDLNNEEEIKFINDNFKNKDILYIGHLVTTKGVKYIQVLAQKGEPKDCIHAIDDLKSFIVAYWTDIVDRIMSFMEYYYELDTYLDYDQKVMYNVFEPTFREMLHIPYKENNF